MDEQEIFNQIRELQKQRDSLSEQDIHLARKIKELKDKLKCKNIKKGYYTNTYKLFCRVYGIKEDRVLVYELDAAAPCLTKETYLIKTFREYYCKECTKKEYDNALNKIVKYFKE